MIAPVGGDVDDLYGDWARVYDYFYPNRQDEVRFWAEFAGPSPQRVMDLMCGTAEVSLGLARLGYNVIGVDLSPAMLAVAAERREAGADYPARNLSLVRANARSLPTPDHAFDAAFVGGNGSFNHLDDGLAPVVLEELHRVLHPGGRVGLELMNPYLLKEIYPERTFGPFRPTPPGVKVEKTTWNEVDRRAGQFRIRQITCHQVGAARQHFEESFSLYVREPEDIRAMLEITGFRDVSFFGGTDWEPFGRWASDLLVIASSSERRRRPT